MSQDKPNEEEAPTPPPDADELPTLKVAVSGVVALVIFGASVVVMFLLMERWRTGPEPQHYPQPAAAGQAQLNLLDQEPYGLVDPARETAGARDRLRTYGWVDRRRGLIHVPVERAMDAVVSQEAGR
jgi:hypothetical protein